MEENLNPTPIIGYTPFHRLGGRLPESWMLHTDRPKVGSSSDYITWLTRRCAMPNIIRMWFTILTKIIEFLIIIIIVLISLAYLTLIERKVMGIMQRRKGPNVVGILGLLQPLIS